VLDAFIIEELKRRERQRDRPQPEAPGPASDERSPQKSESDEEKPQRGVVIIDYSLGDAL
jgi:hypothetical protein